jgi:branched-chain amino acid transport system permease protein
LVGAAAELGRSFDYWRGALGVLVMVIMALAPTGLLGLRWWQRGARQARDRSQAP